MTRQALLDLAARCEAATGADRAIDGSVYAYLTRGQPYVIGNEPGRFPQKPIMGERADVMREMPNADGAEYICAPAYTASLDAAMTLVPEGWRNRLLDASVECRFAWMLQGPQIQWEEGLAPQFASGVGKTPALALTAACLKALAQEIERD